MKAILKSNSGGAYIMTLTVAMLLMTLVLSVLTITVNSRRVTERYGYFLGLYDLAVAGNAQVFLALQQNLIHYREITNANTIEEIMPHLTNSISPSRTWNLTLDIMDLAIQDRYQATTTVIVRNSSFIIHTSICKFIGTRPAGTTVVQSEVRWRPVYGHNLINYLDYNTLEMVELSRVADGGRPC